MTFDRTKFMNIWEIESHFKCPVVGTLLSVEKHKAILKKCGYKTIGMKPHEYHQQIMMKLTDKNNVSVKVNNFIQNQARKHMAVIDRRPKEDIRTLWEKQMATGNIGPMMFAIVSYTEADIELLHDIYGEVHMLAHANMTQIIDVRQQLAKHQTLLGREKQKALEKADRLRQMGRSRKKDLQKIGHLETENHRLTLRLKELEKRNAMERDPACPDHPIRTRMDSLEQEIQSHKHALGLLERKKRGLEIEVFSLSNENCSLKEEIRALADWFKALPGPQEDDLQRPCQTKACFKEACENYRLCAKRVFMIGGITKMKSFYREIIENAGGKFDYHDGYMKNTTANLEARVKRSDLVLCPVNCNSHTACLKVKQLCNRHNKRLKILSSSSLSAVSNALFSADHQTVLN